MPMFVRAWRQRSPSPFPFFLAPGILTEFMDLVMVAKVAVVAIFPTSPVLELRNAWLPPLYENWIPPRKMLPDGEHTKHIDNQKDHEDRP